MKIADTIRISNTLGSNETKRIDNINDTINIEKKEETIRMPNDTIRTIDNNISSATEKWIKALDKAHQGNYEQAFNSLLRCGI